MVSIPLGYFGGIGAASRLGILFKGGNYLDAIIKINTVVFDKTGTLTKGTFDVQACKSAGDISDMAYGQNDKVERIVDQAEQLIFDVTSSNNKSDILPISEIFMGSYQELVENSLNQSGITGLPTGFDELNRRTGGFHGGELILIAGRPGMGKSSFAVNIAEHVSITDKKTVAIFNLEMPKEQIVQKCRRLKQTKNLELIVIDYLQLMQSSGRTESRQNEIAEISRSLKILAKELNIPVIALSQLSRAAESRSDKRPMLSDLRESGAIEQDADMVMFLYRDEYYNPDTEDKNLAECIVAKNRSGETGMFKLGWKGEYTKFSNVEFALKEE